MNVYDKNSKQVATIWVHKNSENIIYNEGKGNILYKYEDYKKLINHITMNISLEEANRALEHMEVNDDKLKQIINTVVKKKKTINNPDQLSLF